MNLHPGTPHLAKKICLDLHGGLRIDGEEFPWYFAESPEIPVERGGLPGITLTIICEELEVIRGGGWSTSKESENRYTHADACEWLTKYLYEHGPQSAQDAIKAAEAVEMPLDVLGTAVEAMGIKVTWELPEEARRAMESSDA